MQNLVSFLSCLVLVLAVSTGAGVAPASAQTQPDDSKQEAPAAAGVQTRKGQVKRQAAPVAVPAKPPAATLTEVPADADPSTMHFWGMCGASAAIPLNGGRVVVANDDDNLLRTYNVVDPADLVVRDEAGKVDPTQSMMHTPRATQDLHAFTKVSQANRQSSSIEGATVGEGITYWIGSHARREDGESRPKRRRLFAMEMQTVGGGVTILQPYGKVVTDLAQQIDVDETMKKAGVQNSVMTNYRRLAHLSPELRGIDIQALAMAPDREVLWVALRNPVRGSSATIIPIENPRAAVEGEPIVFGEPIRLDLGRRGIAAIEWVPQRSEYLIVSGEAGESTGYQLHRWSGDPTAKPSKGLALPADLNVQSLVASEDGKRVLLLSDDSDLMIPVESEDACPRKYEDGLCPCKFTLGPGPQRFRTRWFSLDGLRG